MVLIYCIRINLSQTCLTGSPLFKGEMSDPDSYREQRGKKKPTFVKSRNDAKPQSFF